MIRAPLGGTVVNVKLQKGEQIKAATALFSLVSHMRPWVEANFKETELTHVKVGQKATVVLDTYPDTTWEALVESVSPATGAEFAILPPQNASGNWVKVVQRLPVKLRLLAHAGEPPLRAGMTATVAIDTGRQRSLGLAHLFGRDRGRGGERGRRTSPVTPLLTSPLAGERNMSGPGGPRSHEQTKLRHPERSRPQGGIVEGPIRGCGSTKTGPSTSPRYARLRSG